MTPQDRINAEIVSIKKELKVVSILIKKLNTNLSLDEIEIRASAMTLVSIYNGIEKILERIIKERSYIIDGSNWHTELLNISLKNKLITDELYNELKGFLAFRHFVRHAYSFEINSESIESVIKKVPEITNNFISNLNY